MIDTTMNTKTHDYGEPWRYDENSDAPPIIAADDEPIIIGAAYEVSEERLKRATVCTNACAGIPDPEEAIKAAREALEAEEAWRLHDSDGTLRALAATKRERALNLLTPSKP